ncbi:MAG: hypothetical protein AB7U83_03785 [Vicinamibacterales bacterium]
MAGLIWFVQVVHYPLFARVGVEAFAAYHDAHTRLTTLVVAPLMVVEAGAALWLWRTPPSGVSAPLAFGSVVLVVLAWATTFMVSVPRHSALAAGFDPAVHASLVATNWIRTMTWTAHAAVAVAMSLQAGGPGTLPR